MVPMCKGRQRGIFFLGILILAPLALGQAPVTPPPPPDITLTPPAATVLPGGKVQFFATTKKTEILPLTWQVNGALGGDATSGTITSDGLYTAPPGAPATGIMVTVVSTKDQTKTNS